MRRWDTDAGENREHLEVDAFLEELIAVCRRHNMTLSHEDRHGAFEVIRRAPSSDDADWLLNAQISSKADQ